MTNNPIRVGLAVVLVVLGMGTALGGEKIRVAFREWPGYSFTEESGHRSGYTVEVFRRLALSLGCEIEWVDIGYGRSAAALAEGKVDISPFVFPDRDVPVTFEYTRIPIGCMRMALAVPRDSVFSSDDLSRMDGIIVGMVAANPLREKLVSGLAANGVRCVCREFKTEKELRAALDDGRIGAVLTEVTDDFRDVRPIFHLPPKPFFIAVAKSRKELIVPIDEAVAEIADSEPEFAAQLRAQFFPYELDRTATFSSDERLWIERQNRKNRVFTVDISPVDGFLKIYDESAETIGGLVGRIFTELSAQTGLMFRPVRPRPAAEVAAAFAAGRLDIRVPYGRTKIGVPSAASSSRTLSIRIPQAIVTGRFTGVNVMDGRSTFAVVASDTARLAVYERFGILSRVSIFPTPEEALAAVVAGRVDCYPGDYPLLNRLVRSLSDPLLVDVRINANARYHSELEIAVSPKTDPMLVSVLAKTVALFNREMLIDFENDAEAKEIGFDRIEIRKLKRFAVGALVVVLLTIIAILLYYGSKTRKLLQKSESSLLVAQDAIDNAAMARTKMREALEEAEYAAKAKANFLATMSHEIRTPLNAVIGFSEFLSDPDVSRERIAEYSRGISLSANALLSLLNDILDFSKSESGNVTGLDIRVGECDLPRLFAEMDSIFRQKAEEKGVSLRIRVDSVLPVLGLSESRLRQILMNLVGNAVKFTDQGEIAVAADYADGRLTLTVSDTGIGITPHGLKHIFDPFSQDMDSRGGKVYAGTGLGLSIVKRIVEASGGEVKVESSVGKGTVFTVEIPEVRALGERKTVKTPASVAAGTVSRQVIIVDDVAMNRKVLELHCKSLGVVNTRVFESGVEVLEYLKNPDNPCDVVLSDVWMPGMDGTELARQCAALRPELPVIAVTADTDAAATFDISLFKGVLIKPISAEKLAECLSKGFVV